MSVPQTFILGSPNPGVWLAGYCLGIPEESDLSVGRVKPVGPFSPFFTAYQCRPFSGCC